MAAFVDGTKDIWLSIFMQITHSEEMDDQDHTIIIDCEWAGGNIQKGNAACSNTDKGAYIFDYYRVVNNDTGETQYKSTEGLTPPTDKSVYLMSSFCQYELVLDFNDPSKCEEQLKELAESIEDSSPIAKFHNKSDNVGEGAYLWCDYNSTNLRLKTKGEKHGGKPKVKREQSPIDNELSAKLSALAEKVTPTWRLTQAITETNATEMKHMGEVMKWVNQDIVKEEMPVLHEAGVEPKQLGRYVAKIVKDYYVDSIKGY